MTQCLLVLVVYTECAGCISIPSCHLCLLKTRSILSGLLLVDITISQLSSSPVQSSQHHDSLTPADYNSLQQPGPLSLVEECRGLALIGRELHSIATPAIPRI